MIGVKHNTTEILIWFYSSNSSSEYLYCIYIRKYYYLDSIQYVSEYLPHSFSSASTYFETGPLVSNFSMWLLMSSTYSCSFSITSLTLSIISIKEISQLGSLNYFQQTLSSEAATKMVQVTACLLVKGS